MDRSLELAIHDHLASYLVGEERLDDFKVWLVGATWNLDQLQQTPGIQLANEIKLVLAEHSWDFLTDEELRVEIEALLHRVQAEAIVGR
jgi:hypothetical protein